MANNHNKLFTRKKLAYCIGLSAMVLGSNPGWAQEDVDNQNLDGVLEEIEVTAQRQSIMTANEIKRNASQIVDAIVAEDIGKLPDRTISEALARVPGVTVSRYDNMGDPEHFAGEGSGISVRGLTQVRAELNGRDIFSASGGRGLSFDDVPAELMAGVDTYKSPTADMIEGGLGGIVNLRTRLPFDSSERVLSATVKANYGNQIDEANGEYSGLYSDRWDTGIGEVGLVLDISSSELSSRADNIYTRAYYARDDIETDQTVYVPKGADWRRSDFHRERTGQYLALQWAPNDTINTFFTAFRSKHDASWDEAAFFIDNGSQSIFRPVKGADDWTYNSDGTLNSGTVATNQGLGIPFGTSTRYSPNVSVTKDFSLGLEWDVTDNLRFTGDVQYVKSTSGGKDYTLGLVTYPETYQVKDLGGTPSISVDPAYMTDYHNYSYGQMMAIESDNSADSKAVRLDLEYSFEDSLVTSVKTGARFTEKSTDNRGGASWAARYQPWQIGLDGWQPFASPSDLPKINDPSDLTLFSYGDFQRGNITVPEAAYLIDQEALRDFRGTTDRIVANTPGGAAGINWDSVDLNNPDNINTQNEKTQAAYVRVNFDLESLVELPVDGNIGVRYVHTENVAHGQISYPQWTIPGTNTQPFYKPDDMLDANNDYNNVLPSMNLRYKITDNLLVRFAASKAVWRPDFGQMKALVNLSAETIPGTPGTDGVMPPLDAFLFKMSSDTNPYLEPMEAKQYDLSAEWYFDDRGGLAHLTLFQKDVSKMFTKFTTGVNVDNFEHPVELTGLVNAGTADITGIEIGLNKYFDFLPEPFNGLGIQANYTYIDSSTTYPEGALDGTNPVNTDGDTSGYDTLPFQGLSKNSYNLMFMYEKKGFYARLAYNWRSEYLVSSGANGFTGNDGAFNWRLPIYNDAYGQWDLSMGYSFTDNISLDFQAYNLTEEETKGLMDQGKFGKLAAYTYTQDLRYTASLRMNF